MITGIMIDSREPDWVQKLSFGELPVMVATLDVGDLWAVTDDGATLIVERKTPNDFLHTMKDDRLFPQLARMAEKRLEDQAKGNLTHWPYLVITGEFRCGPNGKLVTDRETGWDYRAIQGALLTIQEIGVFVTFAAGDWDYEAAVLRLGQRSREPGFPVLPPRPTQTLGPDAALLATLPGIGLEKVIPLLNRYGTAAAALCSLTDYDAEIPGIGSITKRKVRQVLGLEEGLSIALFGVTGGSNENGNGNHQN